MIYMICYDIADPKRLKKVSHTLEDYGIRTQYSFFQCEISNEKAKELIKILLSIVDEKRIVYLFILYAKVVIKRLYLTGQARF